MRKETLFSLAAALLVFTGLAGLTAYLVLNYNEATLNPKQAQLESEADAALTALQESVDAASEDSSPARQGNQLVYKAPERFLIWVGDSRTVGMHDAMQNDNLYIAAAGEGYSWFASDGLPELREALADYPDTPVIINLGVNDCDNLANYLALYQQLVADYPDTPFYFLSVNPIDPDADLYLTNEEIADFNAHLKAAYPSAYIDSFTWIFAEDIRTFDGIHYTEDAYRALYKYVVTQLETLEAAG